MKHKEKQGKIAIFGFFQEFILESGSYVARIMYKSHRQNSTMVDILNAF